MHFTCVINFHHQNLHFTLWLLPCCTQMPAVCNPLARWPTLTQYSLLVWTAACVQLADVASVSLKKWTRCCQSPLPQTSAYEPAGHFGYWSLLYNYTSRLTDRYLSRNLLQQSTHRYLSYYISLLTDRYFSLNLQQSTHRSLLYPQH